MPPCNMRTHKYASNMRYTIHVHTNMMLKSKCAIMQHVRPNMTTICVRREQEVRKAQAKAADMQSRNMPPCNMRTHKYASNIRYTSHVQTNIMLKLNAANMHMPNMHASDASHYARTHLRNKPWHAANMHQIHHIASMHNIQICHMNIYRHARTQHTKPKSIIRTHDSYNYTILITRQCNYTMKIMQT